MPKPIFLIEDNPMDVDLTRRAFARHKLASHMEVARDGEEALQWIARWDEGLPQPVVILLDLKLPKVPGLEVLRIFKSHPVYKSIPIVVLTTSKEDADVQSAYGLGVNSYIIKPVDFEKFMEVASYIEMYWAVLNKPSSVRGE